MNSTALHDTLTTLFAELVDGTPAQQPSYMLNRGDSGLLRSLDRVSAADASATVAGGASIAAHVDHLRYGLSLMNQWAASGGDPWAGADWTASWRNTTVSDAQWRALRTQLGEEAHRWLGALGTPRDVDVVVLNGIVGSIAHLAYHLGAIRQIDRAARGPTAEQEKAGA